MRSRPEGVFGREDFTRDETIHCDAIVIGSGAGGGVIAAELAEGGLDVIVLEEGGYHPTEEFDTDVGGAMRKLYRDAGASMAIGSPPIQFAEGRTVGGSTVVNGGMSWRTPERILERWAVEEGVPGIRVKEMERHFARVERYISAKEQPEETVGGDNRLLKRGADAKGWKVIPNIRNQQHCAGSNYCVFGCPTGAKRSTLVSYIPRALAFGARVFSDCRVEKLARHGKKIVGADTIVVRSNGQAGYKLKVRAPITIVAAGAIQTPALLLKSGLRSPSHNIGKQLTLHPNAKVVAVFDEQVDGYKGVHQAYQVREFSEEGFLMAAVMVPASLLAMAFPRYGNAMDEVMQQYNRIVSGGILVEDTVTGQVRYMPGFGPQAFYQITDFDAQRLIRGISLLCELLFAAGAKKIYSPFHGVEDLTSPDEARALPSRDIPKRAIELMTVHMMGTARMGGDRARHVCDPWGKVYDTEGLWVSDASLFPTPIGVNPMETIMALSTRNAEHLLETHAVRNAA